MVAVWPFQTFVSYCSVTTHLATTWILSLLFRLLAQYTTYNLQPSTIGWQYIGRLSLWCHLFRVCGNGGSPDNKVKSYSTFIQALAFKRHLFRPWCKCGGMWTGLPSFVCFSWSNYPVTTESFKITFYLHQWCKTFLWKDHIPGNKS
jgi:hypothetical protein